MNPPKITVCLKEKCEELSADRYEISQVGDSWVFKGSGGVVTHFVIRYGSAFEIGFSSKVGWLGLQTRSDRMVCGNPK